MLPWLGGSAILSVTESSRWQGGDGNNERPLCSGVDLSNINSAVPCHNAARAEYDRLVANGQGPETLAPGSKYGARVQAGRAGMEPAPRRYNSELIGNLGRLGWDIEPYLIN
jgi:hypothetical protein